MSATRASAPPAEVPMTTMSRYTLPAPASAPGCRSIAMGGYCNYRAARGTVASPCFRGAGARAAQRVVLSGIPPATPEARNAPGAVQQVRIQSQVITLDRFGHEQAKLGVLVHRIHERARVVVEAAWRAGQLLRCAASS